MIRNCITDYFSTRKHPTIRRASDWLLNIATVLVAVGFYEFETNDVGITEGIRRLWTAGKDPKELVA
jgi:succinate dehydrogenase (ubiquinone) membrane anchor subunit